MDENNNAPQGNRPSPLPKLLLGLAILILIGLGLLYLSDVGIATQNVEWPRLIGLLAIVVFVGAGFLARPIGTGRMLKSMLSWVAIFLVVAGLYASRDELAGFAGRLLGAIVPGVPIAGGLSGDPNPQSVSFIRSGNGHFAVNTGVNDVLVHMLLDTGASFVTLTSRDAERVGIDPQSLDFIVPIRTANGTMRAASVRLDELTVGPIVERNVPALVAPDGALGQSLLGLTFLDRLQGYTIAGDRLILNP